MIIADVSSNWCGDISLAKELIQKAREGGASLVKFQLFEVAKLNRAPETLKELAKVAMSRGQAESLFKYGSEQGIEVFFSVFCPEVVKWCEDIGVKRYKIAARTRDQATIDAVKATLKPVIASVSPRYPRKHEWADAFYNVSLLYCPSGYPDYPSDIHLHGINFPYDYQGYSDHFEGIDVAKIVLARGAAIIEKHLALRHDLGIDAPWSMTSNELRELKRWEDMCYQCCL